MRARGVDLEVRETGRGPTLVWGHGLLGSMAQEDDAGLLELAPLEATFRLVRYDTRGHGGSEATLEPADYRWPELADDLLGLLDALESDVAVLGGVSMGCATALHAAVRAPRRAQALVLMAPPTAWETRPRQAWLYRVLATGIEWFGLGFFRLLASLPRPTPSNPALAALERSVTAHLGRADARAVVCALRGAAASDLPAASRLAALDMPTLILAWEGDPAHPLSTAERLAELLPQAELHVARSAEEMRGWAKTIAEALGGGGSP